MPPPSRPGGFASMGDGAGRGAGEEQGDGGGDLAPAPGAGRIAAFAGILGILIGDEGGEFAVEADQFRAAAPMSKAASTVMGAGGLLLSGLVDQEVDDDLGAEIILVRRGSR